MAAPPFDLSQTDKLLTTTRSVRKRLDLTAAVDLDEIQECIGIACQAPTGGNVQDWRWIVVTDPDKRAALAELYNRTAIGYFAANREALAARGVTNMDSILDSGEHLGRVLHEVPVHIVPCIFGRPEDMDVFTRASWYGRIYPAVWSLILALRSRGYGTTLTTLHLPVEAEAAQLLGIPDNVHQAALLPVARYTGDDFKPGRRRPVTEVTFWDGWKGTRDHA
jgi:nitroreductase